MGRLAHRTGEGWTYFVTTKSWENVFWFKVIKAAAIVVEKVLDCRDKGDYLLHDFVLMPNRLHIILTPSSVSLEKCMQLIKGGSSFEIHKLRGSRTEVWQQGYFEFLIKNWAAYKTKRDFVNLSPVVEKLVEKAELWEWGSAGGKYRLDPIPQRLKPTFLGSSRVGPKGPTPGAPTENPDTAVA